MTLLADTLTLDARTFAAAWLNVALASGENEHEPCLYRTVLLELHDPETMRLVAFDERLLLAATYGNVGLDETPAETWVVRDPDRRGRALLTYLYRRAIGCERDGLPEPAVTLGLRDLDDPDVPTLDPQLTPRALTIDTGRETCALPILDCGYPTWRAALPTGPPTPAHEFAFDPEIVGRLGKLRDANRLALTLHDQMVAIDARHDTTGDSVLAGTFALLPD